MMYSKDDLKLTNSEIEEKIKRAISINTYEALIYWTEFCEWSSCWDKVPSYYKAKEKLNLKRSQEIKLF